MKQKGSETGVIQVQFGPFSKVFGTHGVRVQKIVAHGGLGNDQIDASAVNIPVELWGDEGNDTLTGGSVADLLHGGAGNDTIQGGTGPDQIFGDDGDDTLQGGDDNDAIDGGEQGCD